MLSIQRLKKGSFICFLWLQTKMLVNDGPSMLVSFIDWFEGGVVIVPLDLQFPFCLSCLGVGVFILIPWVGLLVPLFNIHSSLSIKKRKKKKGAISKEVNSKLSLIILVLWFKSLEVICLMI